MAEIFDKGSVSVIFENQETEKVVRQQFNNVRDEVTEGAVLLLTDALVAITDLTYLKSVGNEQKVYI
ncbi:MAG: hypothetical protein ACTIJA_00600 [Bavariicoccus seileri]|uniref:hypothetical protein n=1 Tax=Bavariicoccus seileri TaxID=549685 RepID=UPI0003B57171|nr:hypothetical protein [Bavariicoccus seileri]